MQAPLDNSRHTLQPRYEPTELLDIRGRCSEPTFRNAEGNRRTAGAQLPTMLPRWLLRSGTDANVERHTVRTWVGKAEGQERA